MTEKANPTQTTPWTRMPPAPGDSGTCIDEQRLAWRLSQEGMPWEAVANEIGCHPAVARHAAAEYEARTDAAAEASQYALFDPA